MADQRAARIAEFSMPWRVKPGSTVHPKRDFDPGYRANILKKNDYQLAFSEMLSATSTAWAPWYVIPADRKWFARICVGAVLAHPLIEIDPQYPTVSAAAREELLVAKQELEAEAPKGAPADPYVAAHPSSGGAED
jgi:Polyphosphate kinase 2 (PPK2)